MAVGAGGVAAETAAKVIKDSNALGSIANTVKNIGQDVISGMRGSTKTFTKQYGERILSSNMTKDQIKEIGERGAREFVKKSNRISPEGKKIAEKYVSNAKNNLISKSYDMKDITKVMGGTKGWGSGVSDKIVGRQIAKESLSYKLGDSVGGGFRDTYRSMKAGHNIKTALSAGFTEKVGGEWVDIGNGMKQKIGGKSQIRMDRVAGAAFGVGVAGRVVTGGGLYRDRYGRVNMPGVPFV